MREGGKQRGAKAKKKKKKKRPNKTKGGTELQGKKKSGHVAKLCGQLPYLVDGVLQLWDLELGE